MNSISQIFPEDLILATSKRIGENMKSYKILTLGFAAITAILFCACEKSNSCTYNEEGGELVCVEKIYKTAKVGNNIWLMENLARLSLTGSSHCYNDSAKNCQLYGSLYPFETAQKICPEGWKLPSQSDFEALDANALQNSKTGFRYYDGKFVDLNESGSFCTSDSYDDSRATLVRVTDKVSYEHFNKNISASVRCIKK